MTLKSYVLSILVVNNEPNHNAELKNRECSSPPNHSLGFKQWKGVRGYLLARCSPVRNQLRFRMLGQLGCLEKNSIMRLKMRPWGAFKKHLIQLNVRDWKINVRFDKRSRPEEKEE